MQLADIQMKEMSYFILNVLLLLFLFAHKDNDPPKTRTNKLS